MAYAVVVAAGAGKRFGRDKIFRSLHGRPVLAHTLRTLVTHPQLEGIVVVLSDGGLDRFAQEILPLLPLEDAGPDLLRTVQGGATRQQSVWAGLSTLLTVEPGDDAVVMVHDGARPFVSHALISRIIEAAAAHGAAVPTIRPRDTIKVLGQGEWVQETPPRNGLGAAQTPQAFHLKLLVQAHQLAAAEAVQATDDAGLVEAAGRQVRVVAGEITNIKLTHPSDWVLAQHFARQQETGLQGAEGAVHGMRIGYGYDLHPLAEGRPLVLGGVNIPWRAGLDGHSDADVLCHAVADALLGAAGLPDIGHQFPPSDPTYEGADSLDLLRQVRELVKHEGFSVSNVDATIIAEAPPLAPHREAICQQLAAAMAVPVERISVKATTHEGLGVLGRGEAMAAHAVCLLYSHHESS